MVQILKILRNRMPLWPYQINVRETLLLSASCEETLQLEIWWEKNYFFDLRWHFVHFFWCHLNIYNISNYFLNYGWEMKSLLIPFFQIFLSKKNGCHLGALGHYTRMQWDTVPNYPNPVNFHIKFPEEVLNLLKVYFNLTLI